MRRRAFLATCVVGSPMVARAQSTRLRRLGVLLPLLADDPVAKSRAAALIQGLGALDWREGVNLRIDWRWTGTDSALIERDAAALAALEPDVLLAVGSPAVMALRRLAGKVPIVFTVVTDPVGQGMVESLTRPGGNITGFSDYDAPMGGKWVEMLAQIVPPVASAAVIYNPATAPFAGLMLHAIKKAAPTLGVAVRTAPAKDESDLETTMAALAGEGRGGLIVLPDFFTFVHRQAIVGLAARHRLPAIYWNRSFVVDGGFMSYGIDNDDLFRRAADYVDRILRGARAGDLPVQNPTKFELVINSTTAKALGIGVPPSLLGGADEVLE
jgi:putative tryptophan/tyrosine transport system substrate-binding protein